MDIVFGDDDSLDKTTLAQWLVGFEQSPQFLEKLDFEHQEFARGDIETFADLAFQFLEAQPKKWDPQVVRSTFLEFMPAKISAKAADYQRMGYAIEQFFDFLDEKKLLQNAAALRREAQKATPQMVKNAGDPKRWGIAKGIFMQAMGEGVTMENEADIAGFLARYNANLGFEPPVQLRHAAPNSYKNIGRNDHIEVKYPDGSIKKDKF